LERDAARQPGFGEKESAVIANRAAPAPTTAAAPPVGRAVRAIVIAGLVAGTLDILYVIVFYGMRGASTQRILQSVSAGLLGRDAAVKGGAATAAFGLALHFIIALGAAAVFYAASRKLRFLVEKPLLGGVLFGAGAWLFMQLVVLPLSAVPPKSFPPPEWWVVFIAHITCVGPPIAFVVRRLAR
jgi:hypothetical protein